MSVAAMSWAWKQTLPPIEKYVLVALSDHANDEDFTCWPSLTHLQNKTNLSRPTVWKAIDRLEKLDAVLRTGVHASGSTIYKVNVGKHITYVGKEITQGNDVTQVTTLPQLGNVGNELGNVGNKVGNDVTPNHKNHHESSITIIYADALFEEAWKQYPERAGGNNKKKAKRAWDARIKEGISPEELIQGLKRYIKFCQHTGKIGTEFVKLGSTFFGPGENWKEEFKVPIKTSGRLTITYYRNQAKVELGGGDVE